ncbi:MAG: YrdB family protein [Acidimicrobiia bacterium]|nr:YrdB family protein [Acidimicrobiia bacterium]
MTEEGPRLNPVQASLRLALELIAWAAPAWWAASLFEGTVASWIAGAVGLLVPMAMWVTFNVPGDPSRSGAAPVPVSGRVRLLVEAIVFAGGAGALVGVGRWGAALVFIALVAFHTASYRERVRWLLAR